MTWLTLLVADARLALRRLRRTPGFSATVLLTLILGIGTSTTVFSVAYSLLLRPLAYRDADKLVWIRGSRAFAEGRLLPMSFSLIDLPEWQTRANAFEGIAMVATDGRAVAGSDGAEYLNAGLVSPTFFDVVRGPMIIGRPLGEGDVRAASVVISERLWRRQFNSATATVGQRLTLDGQPFVIVGVAGGGLRIPDRETDLWLPALTPEPRGTGGFETIARVRSDLSVSQANADANLVIRKLNDAFPGDAEGTQVVLEPVRSVEIGTLRSPLISLFLIISFLLVVACFHVSGLLIARSAARARDVAIQLSLGASYASVLRYALVESGLLVGVGCGAGLILSWWCARLIVLWHPAALASLSDVRVDGVSVVYALASSAILCVTISVLAATKLPSVAEVLRLGARSSAEVRSAARTRRILAVIQVAVAVVLVVGTGMLSTNLAALLCTETGATLDGVVVVLLNVAGGRELSRGEILTTVDRVIARMNELPGVRSAAVGTSVPPDRTRFRVGLTLTSTGSGRVERLIVDAVPASAAYFSSLGIPLRSGRLFDQHDSASAEPVMIMSEGAYQHFFGSAGDRSRTLPLRLPGTPKPANVRVVGVVGDVRFSGLGRVPANTIYLPYLQWPMATVYLFVRCADSPEAALPQIRRAIGEVDRGIAVIAAQTGGEIVGSATASPRLQTFVLVAFTVLALVIAVVGIYGVVSYFVVGRAPEIAIRLALGCSRGRVVFLVVREGVVLGLVGLLSGLAGAFLLGRTFEHALFGIVPFEYSAYVVASAVLMAVVVVSSYLPARRAACIAPSDALR